MNNHFIPRSKILDLYSNSLKEISTHSLSEWLKGVTDNQFIVIERLFVVDAINYIKLNKYTDTFLGYNIKERWDLELIKSYI